MPSLFTYCIPYDDGAAPNPYWGVCTLAICKPRIRKAAQVGDWVVGTGSKNSPVGDKQDCVVYAMRVSLKLRMQEYDAHTKRFLEKKIPDWKNRDKRRRLGDSIYDFSTTPPIQRKGVHNHGNRTRDLSGEFVLMSDHFYYFVDNAVKLPQYLLPIIKMGQGHRSKLNAPYLGRFVAWIEGLGLKPNTLIGKPQMDLFVGDESGSDCTARGCEGD